MGALLILISFVILGWWIGKSGGPEKTQSPISIIKPRPLDKYTIEKLPKYFYFFLWLQILVGIIIFSLGFTEPLALVVTGAVLNAFSMFIYTGMVLWLNLTLLAKPLRPSFFRIIAVGSAFLFYGAFSIFTVYNRFFL